MIVSQRLADSRGSKKRLERGRAVEDLHATDVLEIAVNLTNLAAKNAEAGIPKNAASRNIVPPDDTRMSTAPSRRVNGMP